MIVKLAKIMDYRKLTQKEREQFINEHESWKAKGRKVATGIGAGIGAGLGIASASNVVSNGLEGKILKIPYHATTRNRAILGALGGAGLGYVAEVVEHDRKLDRLKNPDRKWLRPIGTK